MAQTIQIKRSSATATPTSLSAGELAYSDSSDKLFIGQPSNNTVVPIGGKHYTDMLDNLGAGTGLTFSGNIFSANVDGTNSEAPQNSTTSTGRTYKVQVDSSDNLVVNVPWSGGSLSTTLGIGNASGTNNIVMGDDQHIQFGASNSQNLQITYDTTGNGTAKIREVGGGGLLIQGEALTLRGDDGISGMNITPASGQSYDDISFQVGNLGAQLYVTANGVGFATGQNVTSIETSASLSSSNTSLSTTGAVKSYVDNTTANFVTTSGVTSISSTTTDQLVVTDGSTATPELAITTGAVADSGTALATGDQIHTFVTGFNYLTSETFASSDAGNFTFSGDTISTSGSTVTINDALTVTGNLTVQGTTTSVNSNTVELGDAILLLNSDQASANAASTDDAGLEVKRGTDSSELNAFIVWDESADRWSVDNGTGTLSPINAENIAINGGSF